MNAFIQFLLMAAVLLGPFALVATLAGRARRGGHLRWHVDQFRFAAPMAGRLFADPMYDDADVRRMEHDIDAIRTRFDHHR